MQIPPIAWVFGFVLLLVLIPGLSKKVEGTIEGLESAGVKGAIDPVVWIWAGCAVGATGLAFLAWWLTNKASIHEGTGPVQPHVGEIAIPQPPGFNAGSTMGIDKGGLTMTSTSGMGRRRHPETIARSHRRRAA